VNVPFPDASKDESPLDPARDGFEAELASAIDALSMKVRPREFDSQEILRRTARRRSIRLFTASGAALTAVAGVTAFAISPGDIPPPPAARPTFASSAVGTDPLIVPGVFRTMPDGGIASGFTEFGATNYAAVLGGSGASRGVATSWSVNGVELTAQVSWFGDTPQTTLPVDAGNVVGTVNARPAYVSDLPQRQLTFWSGPQGYATAIIFANGAVDQSATTDELLGVAKDLDTAPAAVPMPVRVSGLDPADVTGAQMGQVVPGETHWSGYLSLEIDGRSYHVDVIPGPAVAPTPTGTQTATGVAAAAETVDGLGITVTTDSGKQGSPEAPTTAQVLAHFTSLGADPSGWTTSVIVE
jgi:hypothetical protein